MSMPWDMEPVPCNKCLQEICACTDGEPFQDHEIVIQKSPFDTIKVPLRRKDRFQRDKSKPGFSQLYLLDLENLAGPKAGVESSNQALVDLFEKAPYQGCEGSDDRVVVASGPGFTKGKIGPLESKNCLKLVTENPSNGLLKVLGLSNTFQSKSITEPESEAWVNMDLQRNAAIYDRIIIGSGHIDLEMAVIVYLSIGVEVTVISRREALSEELSYIARRRIRLIPNIADRQELLRKNRSLGFSSKLRKEGE